MYYTDLFLYFTAVISATGGPTVNITMVTTPTPRQQSGGQIDINEGHAAEGDGQVREKEQPRYFRHKSKFIYLYTLLVNKIKTVLINMQIFLILHKLRL